ncbi:MAG: hypothetical protein IJS08_04355, partial [Victivallales bacterium]|nr:hypothetical protein [Victivallales bacterium]
MLPGQLWFSGFGFSGCSGKDDGCAGVGLFPSSLTKGQLGNLSRFLNTPMAWDTSSGAVATQSPHLTVMVHGTFVG